MRYPDYRSPAIQNYGALLVKDWNEIYLPQNTDNYELQNEEEEKKRRSKMYSLVIKKIKVKINDEIR
ncbi:hypothetical protein [Aquimarina muelleri]|uniref:Uncharacterized protein n=1 Tax=Aquimarina muelleri TaxID=279356 RepID=A0A918JYP0_9FLAO|nr:hypothetical protein [Aquimarina muelleri]MCX2764884.1 hypothetical protein [Aquimarina muelleri]GGX34484.1 hypothetical protein GCM10007384_38870 [Aquimarina muelleri]